MRRSIICIVVKLMAAFQRSRPVLTLSPVASSDSLSTVPPSEALP
jgi:hypothetical protein